VSFFVEIANYEVFMVRLRI